MKEKLTEDKVMECFRRKAFLARLGHAVMQANIERREIRRKLKRNK